MRSVLVPTDFTELSRHAVDFAIYLAKPHGAEVEIVHFEDRPVEDMSLHLTGAQAAGDVATSDSLYNAQLFRANTAQLRALEEVYKKEEVRVSTAQMGGGFIKGIKHYLKHKKTDLIVLGTTGEESIQEFFSGNHTEQLIERVKTPVISIRDKVDMDIQDVVLALNLTEEIYPMNTLQFVRSIMKGIPAKLHIVNIVSNEMPENLMQSLNELAKKARFENYMVEVITEEKSNETLLNYAEENDAGLIISITEAKSGLYRFLQHSFTTHLTKRASVPVLSINKRKFK